MTVQGRFRDMSDQRSSRGGRDRFDWESLKGDKDRYNYLGNSVKAREKKPWNQGAEPDWYAKERLLASTEKDEMTEIERIKTQEREYMNYILARQIGGKNKPTSRPSMKELPPTKESSKMQTRYKERTRSRSPPRRNERRSYKD